MCRHLNIKCSLYVMSNFVMGTIDRVTENSRSNTTYRTKRTQKRESIELPNVFGNQLLCVIGVIKVFNCSRSKKNNRNHSADEWNLVSFWTSRKHVRHKCKYNGCDSKWSKLSCLFFYWVQFISFLFWPCVTCDTVSTNLNYFGVTVRSILYVI